VAHRRAYDLAPLLVAAAFFAAVAIAAWFEGKPLWTAYNLVGAALALLLALLVRGLDVPLPRAAAAVCFATGVLHYVGGSLGGHFGIAGVNGLYAVFPWWDRVTHFAGAAGVAALAFALARAVAAKRAWVVPRGFLALFAFTTALAVGVGVELFEFAAWTFFATIDQGFYSNTMMDLYDDVAGALFGAALAHALARDAPLPSQAAAPE